MGLVDLGAVFLLPLLSPPLPSPLSWPLLFITSDVALGATSKEEGSKPHPYPTFLGKASQNKKDLDHFICSAVAWALARGQAGRAETWWGPPQPAAMLCALAFLGPLHQPQPPRSLGASHLEYGLWGSPEPSPARPHPLSPRKWEVEPLAEKLYCKLIYFCMNLFFFFFKENNSSFSLPPP